MYHQTQLTKKSIYGLTNKKERKKRDEKKQRQISIISMEEAPLKTRCFSSSSAAAAAAPDDDDEMVKQEDEEEDRTRNPSPDDDASVSPSHPPQGASGSNKERSSSSAMDAAAAADSSKPSAATLKKQKAAELEATRAEMAEVMEENRRLKLYLEQIMKEYRSLQTRFHEIMNNNQQDNPSQQQYSKGDNEEDDDDEEHDLVSLSLGRSPSRELKRTSSANVDVVKLESCLSLTLDYCRFQEQPKPAVMGKEELGAAGGGEAARDGSPAKAGDGNSNKTARSTGDEQGSQQQNPAKKARVSVRARCDTPTMNDGCQWRKYGQKIAKGNPCPRAYYRCTVGPSCPVRKQVQRCADDMSILITTYEGNHNHPLPMSATTMASTTSAAASMLLSGSSSSSSTAAVPGNLHGLNMYVSDNNMNSISSRPPFYFSNNNNNYTTNNNSTYSPSPSYPTITLDLTSTTNNNNILNTSSSQPHSSSSHSNYARFSSRFGPASSLNFGSEPATWGLNNGAGILNYGIGHVGRSGNGPLSGAHYRMSGPAAGPSSSSPRHNQSVLADSTMVAAATKAITADPSFQSALAAALTSIIGKNNNSSSSSKVVTSSSRGGGDQPSYLMNVKASGDANTAPSSATSLSRTGSLSHHGQSAAGSGLVFQAPSSSSSSSSPHSYSMPAFTAAARDASTSPSDDN